jgi:hypothetical protein
MMPRRSLLVLAGVALLCAAARAEDAGGSARSPGDLTEAERVAMMTARNRYQVCLLETALAELDAAEDIRAIADLALGHCQPHLDRLESTIVEWGVDPAFAAAFARSVRDAGARRLLPELAVRKGG